MCLKTSNRMTIPYNSDVLQSICNTRHPNITKEIPFWETGMSSSSWILALWASVFPCLSCLRQWLPCLLSFVKQTMKLVARMIPNLQAYRTPVWVQSLSYIWGHNAFASFKVEVKDLILLENKKAMIPWSMVLWQLIPVIPLIPVRCPLRLCMVSRVQAMAPVRPQKTLKTETTGKKKQSLNNG